MTQRVSHDHLQRRETWGVMRFQSCILKPLIGQSLFETPAQEQALYMYFLLVVVILLVYKKTICSVTL